MFSKGIVLIFLTLFLSSSIAHAVPYENRAANPCDVRLPPLIEEDFVSHVTFRTIPVIPPLSLQALLRLPGKLLVFLLPAKVYRPLV